MRRLLYVSVVCYARRVCAAFFAGPPPAAPSSLHVAHRRMAILNARVLFEGCLSFFLYFLLRAVDEWEKLSIRALFFACPARIGSDSCSKLFL